MCKEDDDRRHAQEALRQANSTEHDVDQMIWLRLAQTWLNLLPSDHSWRQKPLTTWRLEGLGQEDLGQEDLSQEELGQEEFDSSRGTVLPFRRN